MSKTDREIVKGKQKGSKHQEYVVKHLLARDDSKQKIPYFEEDGKFWYLEKKDTNKQTGEIRYSYRDLTSKLSKEAQLRANKLKLVPKLELYEKIFGKVVGKQVFLEEVSKTQKVYSGVDPDLYDIDHLGSQKFKYPHLSRNLNKQLIEFNRSEGARRLTKQQEIALRVLPDDLEGTLRLQGPEPNDIIKDQIMGRVKGGATKDYTGISAFAANQSNEYQTQFTSKNVNNGNGNGVNGNGTNGNGTNGKNGNGLTVNGKNGKNGFLKGLENVTDYSGMTKFGRSTDQLINIGVNASTGNYGGAAIGAATFATSKALQDPKVQARVAKQITQLVTERGAKSAAKFIPGLDIVLSGKESLDYLKRGRWDQAGIAALSGAIGWIPIIGDGASAALDLSNTGIDIARLQAPTGANKKKSQNRFTRFFKGLNT